MESANKCLKTTDHLNNRNLKKTGLIWDLTIVNFHITVKAVIFGSDPQLNFFYITVKAVLLSNCPLTC